MCNRLRRSATATRSSAWVAWLPLVFVAAMLFWTVALGLGGLSLMAVSALSGSDADDVAAAPPGGPAPMVTEPMPGNVAFPIVVRLEESAEPEDSDSAGGAQATVTADTAPSDDDSAQSTNAP